MEPSNRVNKFPLAPFIIIGCLVIFFVVFIYYKTTHYSTEPQSPRQVPSSQTAADLEVQGHDIIKLMLAAHATYHGLKFESLRDYLASAKSINEAEGKAVEFNGWTTNRRDDGKWEASFSMTFLGNEEKYQWLYDPEAKTILALNPEAAELRLRVETPYEHGEKMKRGRLGNPAADESTPKKRKHH